MKRYFLPILLVAATVSVQAAQAYSFDSNVTSEDGDTVRTVKVAQKSDSIRLIQLQEIEVTATRATAETPVAYTNLSAEQIAANSYGLDMPSVLALTPSMIATNETGIGIGGTSMRLRGTDATRLNVTINGVAMNNPDSHSMYWYDTPDLISAIGSIQVQRGAGLSTNGTGAFGGAINLTTLPLQTHFSGEASLSYGSYNTNKEAIQISSGLLGGHWAVDARVTRIASDGYVDRGATDLKSYFLQGGYYNGGTCIKLLSFGGKAKTYLTYTGATKEEMALYGRRYHTGGQYATSAGQYLVDGEHVAYYDDQTDNYLQLNNQLLISQQFNEHWSTNATLFYTYGYGYYNQYKSNRKLLEYGFGDDVAYDSEGNKVRADLIRKKLMRNHTEGINASATYKSRNVDLDFGGSWSYYTCPHWGELSWVDGLEREQLDGRWYDNNVEKQDANLFVRANWNIARGLHLYGELQYRYVDYQAWGTNDNYVSKSIGMQPIDVDKQYHFFNPHVGATYTLADRNRFHFSFAIAQKEPTRSDFTDRYLFAEADTYPTSEKLYDYELGYTYTAPRLTLEANLYYMSYRNQLVPTGRINDGYDALNDNVKDSYRRGIELSVAWKATQWLTAGANATFSQNRIKNYTHRVVDYALEGNVAGEYGYYEVEMGTTRLAYSPKSIVSGVVNFHHKGFEAEWRTQYVSKQYFTNYENDNMALDAYCVTDLNLAYTFHTHATRSVRVGILINNLLNTCYASNGYGWSEAYNGAQTDYAYYFPQAPTNVLANVTIKF